jgi:hypothetical protein
MISSNITLWKTLALSKAAWQFPHLADREFLELNTLKHMRESGSLEVAGSNALRNPNKDHDLLQRMAYQKVMQRQQHSDSNNNSSTLTASSSSLSSSGNTSLEHSAYNPSTLINWRKIVRHDRLRDAARGTGAAMLDMGSCTCVVGLGGTNQLPVPFPTISLSSTVVGDEVAKLADRLSHEHSISLPILHANETGKQGDGDSKQHNATLQYIHFFSLMCRNCASYHTISHVFHMMIPQMFTNKSLLHLVLLLSCSSPPASLSLMQVFSRTLVSIAAI